jgi:Tol biopolymer transport system component
VGEEKLEPSRDCKMQRQVKLPMRLFLCFSVLVTLLTIAACSSLPGQSGGPPSNTPVVPSGLTGRLLYTRDGGLWTLALDSSQTRQIVPSPELGQVTSARWSPDGSRIAYAFAEVRDRRVPVSEIRVAAADGSGVQTLLSSQSSLAFGTPIWAPDGSHLYLTKTGLDQGQRVRRIERLDVDSGASEVVFDDVAPFDVSPDGRWLAVARAGNSGQSILLMDLTSGDQRTVVPERAYDTIAMPRFDPSSSKLLFTAASLISQAPEAPATERFAAALLGLGRAYAHGLPQDIYATPLAGGAASKVAAISADEPALAPSPDGSQLAVFTVDALSTMPLSGGRLTPLLTPGGYGSVDWVK